MQRRRTSPVRLLVQQLECRLTPAGTVTVDVNGGNIKIIGDDLENDISIYVDDTPAANTLHIVGNNGTGVVLNDPLPSGDAIGRLTIDLKKAGVSDPNDPRGVSGVDRVEMHDMFLGDLLIKGKNGGVVNIDSIYAQKATIDFHVGNGISEVDADKGPLGSDIRILNSDLGFDGSHSPPKQKGVTILTKDCKDHVEVRATNVQGNLTVKTRGDNDEIGLFGVYNFFGSGNFGTQGLNIDAGTGDDFFAASGIDIIKSTNIKMGDGNDKAVIGRFEGYGASLLRGRVSIDLGKGDDVLGLGHSSNPDTRTTSFASKLTIRGSAGDDTLMMGQQLTLAALNHSIDGGKQTAGDTLEVLSPPFDPNDKMFKNWETRGGFVASNLIPLIAEVGERF